MAGMEYDPRPEIKDFVRSAIDGARLLMKIAHNIETSIQYQQVMKNNGPQDALTFKREGENIAPTVYIKDFFERYKSGEDINSVIKDLVDAGYQAMQHKIDMPDITPEEAHRCIRLDLVNEAKNLELLKDVPYFTVGEGDGALAAYPRWEINPQLSFKVTEEIASKIDMTPTEVLSLAQENTNNMHYNIDSIGNVLHGMFQDMGKATEELDHVMAQEQPQMLVMTTPDCIHGASAILSKDAMEQAREMLGTESVFIIPSSIHECLIVPDNGDIKPEILTDMIKEINLTELDPVDILSDFPLKYAGGKITMAVEAAKKVVEKAIDMENKLERKMTMSIS